jgi:hypothetical protein
MLVKLTELQTLCTSLIIVSTRCIFYRKPLELLFRLKSSMRPLPSMLCLALNWCIHTTTINGGRRLALVFVSVRVEGSRHDSSPSVWLTGLSCWDECAWVGGGSTIVLNSFLFTLCARFRVRLYKVWPKSIRKIATFTIPNARMHDSLCTIPDLEL